MAAREIIVKKYVVRLSGEEREQLLALTRKGRGPAQRLMKARILLKADASEAGEGWSNNQIIEALETSASMVYRVRKQLVEEGLEAVLRRKPRAAPAVPKIFDGEKEAKLIALACSEPPKGRARWTLRLERVSVELDRRIPLARAMRRDLNVEHVEQAMGHSAEGQQRVRGGHGRRPGRVHAATRSRYASGLPGRDLEAIDCRNARSGPDEKGAASEVRLRIRAQRHGQSLHDVRTARRLAACQKRNASTPPWIMLTP